MSQVQRLYFESVTNNDIVIPLTVPGLDLSTGTLEYLLKRKLSQEDYDIRAVAEIVDVEEHKARVPFSSNNLLGVYQLELKFTPTGGNGITYSRGTHTFVAGVK